MQGDRLGLCALLALWTATPASGASRAVVWRALDHLDSAEIDAPRVVAAYRALLRSRAHFNRNPYARHAPPRDRLDLVVTRLANARQRAWDLRHALYLPPPARARWTVTVPPGARLQLGLGAVGGTPRVRVRIDGREVLARRAAARGWADVEVDLAAWAGRRVSLTLATDGRGHAFLADPAIAAEARPAPNVLVVMVDTLATWAMGCYGQKLPVTPNLDRLCREGTVFDNAIANSNWTRPSVLSMLASWLPGRVGISYNQFHGLDISPERARFYARAPEMLPNLMRRGGYRTAAIVNNLFLQGYHRYGVDTGFEQVVDYRRHVEDTVDITDAAIRFLERNQGQRFFLFVNYNAPHVHYVPPARYAREIRRMGGRRLGSKTAAYLGEVRYTDEEAGRLLRALGRLGLDRDTLVVLTADHGEVHDARHAYRVVRTGRWSRFGHAVTLYDEEVKVPLVLRQPGTLPAGQRVAAQVRLLDLAPTILEHAGLPPSAKHEGRSVLNLVRGQRDGEERIAFLEGRMMRAVRAEGFKYFWRLPGYDRIARGGRVVRVPEELYDLSRDPREHHDLSRDPAHAERLARLRAIGQRFMASAVPDEGKEAARPARGSVTAHEAWRIHLRFVGDGTERLYEGRLAAPGGVRRFRLSRHEAMDEVWRDKDGSLRFRVRVGRGHDDLWAEVGSGSELHIELPNGAPLRVGPYGLPLVDPGRIAGEDLALLDAAFGPPTRPGRERGVFLWRERVARAATAGTAPAGADAPSAEADEAGRPRSEGDVEQMLRDWGYIQGTGKGGR